MDEIQEFVKSSGLDKYEKFEVSEFSNGNKAVCSKEKLRFNITGTFPRTVSYTMENYQQALYSKSKENVNALIGYEIYYREITEEQFLAKNISRFEGLDACSGMGNIWNINDFRPRDISCKDGSADCGLSPGPNNEFPVNVYQDEEGWLPMNLKPFTPYALYATTLMVPYLADKATGAQTDMIYFRTRSEPPQEIRNLETRTPGQNSIKVSWLPPRNPHGIIDHYDIVLNYIPQADFARTRKFCGNKGGSVVAVDKAPRPVEPVKDKIKSNATDVCPTCTCLPGDGQKNKIEDRGDEHIEEQEFYSELINKIFNYNTISLDNRKKRSVNDLSKGNSLALLAKQLDYIKVRRKIGALDSFEKLTNETSLINGSNVYSTIYLRVPGNQTKVVIDSLKHYALYEVKVMACQRTYKIDLKCRSNCRLQKDCSPWTVKEAKTQPKPNADNIVLDGASELDVFTANETTGDTFIRWRPPADPNELIGHYILRSDERLGDETKENFNELCISLSQLEELEDGRVEYRLERPGEYWISLQAVSLAGSGSPTPWQYVKAGHQKFIRRNFYCHIVSFAGQIY